MVPSAGHYGRGQGQVEVLHTVGCEAQAVGGIQTEADTVEARPGIGEDALDAGEVVPVHPGLDREGGCRADERENGPIRDRSRARSVGVGRIEADGGIGIAGRVTGHAEGDVGINRVVTTHIVVSGRTGTLAQAPIGGGAGGGHGSFIGAGRGRAKGQGCARTDGAPGDVGHPYTVGGGITWARIRDDQGRAGGAGDIGAALLPLVSEGYGAAGGDGEGGRAGGIDLAWHRLLGNSDGHGWINGDIEHRTGHRAMRVGDDYIIIAVIGRTGSRHGIAGASAHNRTIFTPLVTERTCAIDVDVQREGQRGIKGAGGRGDRHVADEAGWVLVPDGRQVKRLDLALQQGLVERSDLVHGSAEQVTARAGQARHWESNGGSVGIHQLAVGVEQSPAGRAHERQVSPGPGGRGVVVEGVIGDTIGRETHIAVGGPPLFQFDPAARAIHEDGRGPRCVLAVDPATHRPGHRDIRVANGHRLASSIENQPRVGCSQAGEGW